MRPAPPAPGHLPGLGPGPVQRTEAGRHRPVRTSTVSSHPSRNGWWPPGRTHRRPSIVPLGILSCRQWSSFHVRGAAPRSSAGSGSSVRWRPPCTRTCSPRPIRPVRSAGADGDELPSIPLGDALGLRRPVTARGVGTVQRILLAAAERFRRAGSTERRRQRRRGHRRGQPWQRLHLLGRPRRAVRHPCPGRRAPLWSSGWRRWTRHCGPPAGWPAGWTAGCRCSARTVRCCSSGPTRSSTCRTRRADRPDERRR